MPADQDEWMLIGRVVGAFGVKGELKVQALTDFPDRFSRLASVYLGDDHVEHALVSARSHTHVLIRLDGVDSRDQAQRMRGSDVWIPRTEAMALPEGEYFVDDIIGLVMETDDGRILGPVRDILSTGANDVYIVAGAGGELLVPAIHDVVREIDITSGKVIIHPMEGLLD